MIITSIPARQLIEALRDEDYFDVYCFVLVREIQGKELLLDLFRHHSSFCSVSGSHILIVLFSQVGADMSPVREAKREIYQDAPESLQSIYHHDCRNVTIQLLQAMRYYEWQLALAHGGSPGYAYESLDHLHIQPAFEPFTGRPLPPVDVERYLASMTTETEALKEALDISEAELPCVVFVDKRFSEWGILHLNINDGILVVYDAIRELVIRNSERRAKTRKLDGQIRSLENNLKNLGHRRRRHAAKIQAMEAELDQLALARRDLEQEPPEPISSIISELERKKAIRSNASRLFKLLSASQTLLKIVGAVKSLV